MLLCCSGGGRRVSSEAEPEKKGGVGGKAFKDLFLFLTVLLLLYGIKLN